MCFLFLELWLMYVVFDLYVKFLVRCFLLHSSFSISYLRRCLSPVKLPKLIVAICASCFWNCGLCTWSSLVRQIPGELFLIRLCCPVLDRPFSPPAQCPPGRYRLLELIKEVRDFGKLVACLQQELTNMSQEAVFFTSDSDSV